MNLKRTLPRKHEGGFTLIELLITVTIEAFVLTALATALIATFKGTTNVNESFVRTSDARIAAHYVISDARNSSGPETSLGTSTCTDAHPPVAGAANPIVEFTWTSTNSAGVGVHNVVDYILVNNALLRRECVGASTVSVDDHVVAWSVGSVTATCSPTANCSGNPTTITVTVSETPDSTGSVYTYSLTGAFRKLGGSGPPHAAPSPIFLMGAGNCSSGATGLIVSGGAAMRVYGTADINAGDIPGGAGCSAMSLGTDAGNYVAGGTQIFSGPSGGTCVPNGSSTCPTITNYSPALTDPYASLPPLAGVPVGACSGTNPAPVGNAYPAGVYPQALNVPSTATFSGTYIFCAGVSFTNGARVTGTDVLFYFKGGTMTVGGDSQIALAAKASGPYSGLVIWQAAGDATTMSISNGGVFTLSGAIYAPSAQVSFSGGSVTTSVTSIVAKTIYLSGGADVTIGTPSPLPLSFSLPAGLQTSWPQNLAYTSPAFTPSGGDGTYAWTASNLPTGLSMGAGTGVISGTPSVVQTKSVTVTLSDALGDDVATQTFTLAVNAAPTVTSTSPASRGQGAVNQNVTINGTNFQSGAVASFSGTGITVNSTTWVSANNLTANITIAANATTGARDVTVTNPDTATTTKTAAFTVTGAVSITSVTPPTAPKSTTLNVVIHGTGFVNGAVVSFVGSNLPTINSTTWNNSTQITVNVSLGGKAKTWDVVVTNPDGGSDTEVGGFAST